MNSQNLISITELFHDNGDSYLFESLETDILFFLCVLFIFQANSYFDNQVLVMKLGLGRLSLDIRTILHEFHMGILL